MTFTTNPKKILKNKWVLTLAGTALFLGISLLLLPVIAKYYITKQIVENGADTAVIDKLRINLFAGRIALEGVDVTLGGRTVLSNQDINFDIGMMSLFKKQAEIEKAALDGLTLEIELYQDGRMRFGSYTSTPAAPDTLEEPEGTAKPWVAQANQVTMSNCRIHFKTPDLDLTLQVDEASLVRFTTAPGDKPGTFSLSGSVNGTPVRLNLNSLRVKPDIIAGGRIQVDGFELDNLANFLKPYLAPFTGRASVDGTAMFKRSVSGDIFIDYDGMIELEQGHIGGNTFSVQGAPVRWEKGPIHFERTEKKGIVIDIDGSLTGKELAVDIPDPVIKIREPAVAIDGKVQVLINDEVTVDTCAGFTLKHTTFSMPPLQAEAADVSWQGKGECIKFNSGTTEKELSVRAQGELAAANPSFAESDETIELAVNGSSLSWNGEVSYLLGLTGNAPSIVETNGSLKGANLVIQQGDLMEYKQRALTAEGKGKVNLGLRITVNYDGTLGLEGTDLQMGAMSSSGKTIDWQGKSAFSLGADNDVHLILNGSLNTTELAAQLKEPAISFAQKSLTLTTKGSVDLGRQTTVQGTASFKSSGFAILDDDSQATLLTLEQFTIDTIEAPGGETITIKQALADGLEVNIRGNMPLHITIPSIAMTDIQTDDLATFRTNELSARSPVVIATKNMKKLAGLETLRIRNIQAGLDQRISVDQVNFDELFFLGESAKKKDNICSIAGARLSKLGWSPEKGMTGESLSFADLFCTLIRDKDGNLILNKELAAMRTPGENKEKPTDKSEEAESSPTAHILLSQVTLRGESGLHFEDHTLAVPFISDLSITTLQIKDIDSGNPSEPASVQLIGSVDKRAPMVISGTIAPFAASPAVNLKLKLKNYPLANLSAYTVQSVGVALAGGQLKLKSKVKLKDNQLDMSNEVVLKKLETSTISKELAAKLDNRLPIPLDSALSMLRDSEGNITLDVPLQGPLDQLNVGISDIMITALSTAIVPAASGYLMYTLGPYGALAWVGMKVGEKMLEIRLPPIEFPPGVSAVPEGLKDYADRLAKILRDKPTEDFQLCPKSSAWEFVSESEKEKLDKKGPELSDKAREKLMTLGQERAVNIKKYLIRNYGIDKDRLLICITKIETKKSAKPRVDIQM